jgi:hypothetical protein
MSHHLRQTSASNHGSLSMSHCVHADDTDQVIPAQLVAKIETAWAAREMCAARPDVGSRRTCRMNRKSIETIKQIAESVARDEQTDVEITAVTPCESRGAYAEVLITRRQSDGGPARLLIGIARDQPEQELRRTLSARLRARA